MRVGSFNHIPAVADASARDVLLELTANVAIPVIDDNGL